MGFPMPVFQWGFRQMSEGGSIGITYGISPAFLGLKSLKVGFFIGEH